MRAITSLITNAPNKAPIKNIINKFINLNFSGWMVTISDFFGVLNAAASAMVVSIEAIPSLSTR